MKKSGVPAQDLSDLEREVMGVIWKYTKATSRQIKEDLDSRRPLALTTILTILTRLKKKQYIEEVPSTGRAMVFSALVPRESIQKKSIHGVLSRFFSGSPASLVSHLLHEEIVNDVKLIEIRKILDERMNQRRI